MQHLAGSTGAAVRRLASLSRHTVHEKMHCTLARAGQAAAGGAAAAAAAAAATVAAAGATADEHEAPPLKVVFLPDSPGEDPRYLFPARNATRGLYSLSLAIRARMGSYLSSTPHQSSPRAQNC